MDRKVGIIIVVFVLFLVVGYLMFFSGNNEKKGRLVNPFLKKPKKIYNVSTQEEEKYTVLVNKSVEFKDFEKLIDWILNNKSEIVEVNLTIKKGYYVPFEYLSNRSVTIIDLDNLTRYDKYNNLIFIRNFSGTLYLGYSYDITDFISAIVISKNKTKVLNSLNSLKEEEEKERNRILGKCSNNNTCLS